MKFPVLSIVLTVLLIPPGLPVRAFAVETAPTIIIVPESAVIYCGVENPLSITAAGIQRSAFSMKVNNGKLIERDGATLLVPNTTGRCVLLVYGKDNRKITQKEFQVKLLPVPVPKISNMNGGPININVLLAATGVTAVLEAVEVKAAFTVTRFSISAVLQGAERTFTSLSNRFTTQQKDFIRGLNRGQKLYVHDIKARDAAGNIYDLPVMLLVIN